MTFNIAQCTWCNKNKVCNIGYHLTIYAIGLFRNIEFFQRLWFVTALIFVLEYIFNITLRIFIFEFNAFDTIYNFQVRIKYINIMLP